MKKSNLLIALSIFSVFGAAPAFAGWGDKVAGWWGGHDKWATYKNFRPYLENGKDPQNAQWGGDDWYVQDWIAQHASSFELIDGFYRNDILREQTDQDGAPVVIVGPMFYRLSGYDKRRVITTLDAVYGITEAGTYPVILLHDWHTKRQIGIYGKDGLQLQ